MGSVWHAEHLGLKAAIAIKLLAPDLEGRQDSIARFLREAQSAASLRSPHVVRILDHGLDEPTQTPFIAMELLEGESLAERLARVTRLSPAETSKWITQVARALSRAQELGIVHRDLKPANLFLVRNEDDEILKVLDFGLATWRRAPGALTQGAATATSQIMGTAYYMSPEQMNDSRDVDQRSDLWSLAVIAFECLTGRRPYDGENLISIALKVCGAPTPRLDPSLGLPSELNSWFTRALAKNPAERFQTARELADQLRRACRLESTASPPSQAGSSSAEHLLVAAAPANPDGRSASTPELGEGGHTAIMPRSRPGARPAKELVSENAQSGQPVARSIAPSPAPGHNTQRRRLIAWVSGAAAVLAALVAIGFERRPSSAGAPQVPFEAPSMAPHPAESPAVIRVEPEPDTVNPPTPAPLVSANPVSSADVTAEAPPSEPSVKSNPLAVKTDAAPSGSGRKAPPAIPVRPPSAREQRAAPPASAKRVDIERKPSF